MNIKPINMIITAFYCLLMLSGCNNGDTNLLGDGGNSSANIIQLTISPSTQTIPLGLTGELHATAQLDDGTSKDVTANVSWNIANNKVITIDDEGEVVPLTVETTKVEASYDGVTSNSVTVQVVDAVAVKLQVTPANASIAVGLEQSFTATAIMSDNTTVVVTNDSSLEWSSTNAGIASISTGELDDSNGIATGVSNGSTVIGAKFTTDKGVLTAESNLTVTGAIPVSLSVTTPYRSNVTSTPVGLTKQYIATLVMSDNSTFDVTNYSSLEWSTQNETVATITTGQPNDDGVATARAKGETGIIATFRTDDGRVLIGDDTIKVTDAIATALEITPKVTSFPVGLDASFTATEIMSDGNSIDVTDESALSWTADDDKITIDGNTATGKAPGETGIMASIDGLSATATIIVTNAIPVELQVDPADASTPVGLTAQFKAIATMSDSTQKDVTDDPQLSWSSDDAGYATIDDNGLATGVTVTAEEPVIMTASLKVLREGALPITDAADLTVTKAVPVTLQVDPDDASAPVGVQQAFTATVTMSDGNPIDVTDNDALSWSSDDAETAMIISNQPNDNGVATGKKVGEVGITASLTTDSERLEDTQIFEVTPAIPETLEVTPINETMNTGQTREFAATATMSDSSTQDVTDDDSLTWRSDDTDVATITTGGQDGNGVVTGVSEGETTITATLFTDNGSIDDSTNLTINQARAHILTLTCGPIEGEDGEDSEENCPDGAGWPASSDNAPWLFKATATDASGEPVYGIEVDWFYEDAVIVDEDSYTIKCDKIDDDGSLTEKTDVAGQSIIECAIVGTYSQGDSEISATVPEFFSDTGDDISETTDFLFPR
ncbi:Ig-like domain-containing protein [Vibrio algivorus]|nr:Ig-like domain-containing protein [Vibrio algivorus]